MGNILSGFRRATAGSSQSSLFKASTSSPSALQEQIPSPVTPHQSHKKSTEKEPTKIIAPETKSNLPIIFESPNLSDAKALFNSFISSNKNTPSGPGFYNSILQSYSSISSPQNAIFFLNHMTKTHPSFSPNRFTYHVLLMPFCAVPDETSLANVHHALNLMKNTGFPPNHKTTDVAVRTLCGCGREEHAIELVKDLTAQNVLPDARTYNFLVRHLFKNRSLSTVYCFINDMREGFGIKPDLFTYTIMINNVCNSKNLHEAMRLLGVLCEEGYKPDSYVYTTIMKGYCLLNQGDEVMGVYKKMQEEGVKPDRYTYNTLIYGLCKTCRVEEARKFLGVMAEMGHFPDEVSYTSLMSGMCRQGDALGALALLEEMKAKGCVPNSRTYNTLLHGLCKARLLDKGVELYGLMKKGDIKLEIVCYGIFLRNLCMKGRVAEAYEVFDYAVESKSLNDVIAYSTLEISLNELLRKAREQGLAV